jgi:hypothetical protein
MDSQRESVEGKVKMDQELVSFVKEKWSDAGANLASVVGELCREKGLGLSESRDIARAVLGDKIDHRSISQLEDAYFDARQQFPGNERRRKIQHVACELIQYIRSEDGSIRLRVSHLLRMCVDAMAEEEV